MVGDGAYAAFSAADPTVIDFSNRIDAGDCDIACDYAARAEVFKLINRSFERDHIVDIEAADTERRDSVACEDCIGAVRDINDCAVAADKFNPVGAAAAVDSGIVAGVGD